MEPHSLEANGLCNPFTNKKNWRIACGKCRHVWDEKVPIREEVPACVLVAERRMFGHILLS